MSSRKTIEERLKSLNLNSLDKKIIADSLDLSAVITEFLKYRSEARNFGGNILALQNDIISQLESLSTKFDQLNDELSANFESQIKIDEEEEGEILDRDHLKNNGTNPVSIPKETETINSKIALINSNGKDTQEIGVLLNLESNDAVSLNKPQTINI